MQNFLCARVEEWVLLLQKKPEVTDTCLACTINSGNTAYPKSIKAEVELA